MTKWRSGKLRRSYIKPRVSLVSSGQTQDKMAERTEGAEAKSAIEDEMQEETDPLEIADELKPLAKYLELLQKNSQKTLIAAVVKSVKLCKSEIKGNLNEMIASLKTSVEDIKGSFHQLEKSVDEKIGKIQQKVEKAESMADAAIRETKELEQKQQGRDAENNQLREKIKIMESEIHSF